MSARAKTRKRASQLCLVLLGAALALAAPVTLSTRVDTSDTSDESTTQEGLQATTTKKSETLHERRDFVTLKEIWLVGAAVGLAAAGLVSRRDDYSTSPHARSSSWPPWPPRPAAPKAPAPRKSRKR